MKKIFLILMSLALIHVSIFSSQTDAAVVSKVVSSAAKKVAKEVVKDAAVNSAVKMTISFAMPLTEEQKYKALNSGYDAVCLPKVDGTKDSACSKPVQVKKNLTSADKTAIAKKAEDLLDKKTGVTGWIKFLDWFAPLFIIGGIITWVAHELDPDTMGLFDEIAKQTLFDLGFIMPLAPNEEAVVVGKDGKPPAPTDFVKKESSDPVVTYADYKQSTETIFNSTQAYVSTVNMPHPNMPSSMLAYHLQRDVTGLDSGYTTSNITVKSLFRIDTASYRDLDIVQKGANAELSFANPLNYSQSRTGGKQHTYVSSNGQVITDEISQASGWGATIPNLKLNDITDILFFPTTLKHTPRPDYNPLYYYITRKINIFDKQGGVHKITISVGMTSPITAKESSQLTVIDKHTKNTNTQLSYKITALTDVTTYEPTPYTPKIEEFAINTIGNGTHTTGSTIKVMPPTAIPITTPTGVPVVPREGSTTGWTNVTTGEDITVNEDDLIVGEPVRTPDGEGYQIPGGTPVKDPAPTPKEEPPIKEEDFSDLSCARIKKPDFKPLTTAVTTSFPFSIPWDLARMFNSAFSGIGSERPAFNYSFEFNGQVKEWNIEFPKYFDNWTSFTRPLLIIIFDAGLIYAMYRFTKGGD